MVGNKKHMQKGFTLVELMITLLISMIVVGSIYTAFISQQHTYIVQDQVAEMQQNIRAALMMITREIRMAGYDPKGTANAGITTALPGQISFTMDINSDGDTNDSGETIDYGFTPSTSSPNVNWDVARDGIPDKDNDGDGVIDAMSLGRQIGGAGGYQPLAENIQAIEFYYTLADGTQTTSPSNPDQIRAVTISILARAGNPDRDFNNTKTYTTASGSIWGPYGDLYRRRFFITTVLCRNMGL